MSKPRTSKSGKIPSQVGKSLTEIFDPLQKLTTGRFRVMYGTLNVSRTNGTIPPNIFNDLSFSLKAIPCRGSTQWKLSRDMLHDGYQPIFGVFMKKNIFQNVPYITRNRPNMISDRREFHGSTTLKLRYAYPNFLMVSNFFYGFLFISFLSFYFIIKGLKRFEKKKEWFTKMILFDRAQMC